MTEAAWFPGSRLTSLSSCIKSARLVVISHPGLLAEPTRRMASAEQGAGQMLASRAAHEVQIFKQEYKLILPPSRLTQGTEVLKQWAPPLRRRRCPASRDLIRKFPWFLKFWALSWLLGELTGLCPTFWPQAFAGVPRRQGKAGSPDKRVNRRRLMAPHPAHFAPMSSGLPWLLRLKLHPALPGLLAQLFPLTICCSCHPSRCP